MHFEMQFRKIFVASYLLATLAYSAVFAKSLSSTNHSGNKWWQGASFYQIYPRSFKDSNGDGVGDLKGITEKLAYLKEIGITATWLSPIFISPMVDFGYDIKNFYQIDPIFGTMADFEVLIARANQIGVKIILDFVPNHSSDESEWFIKSEARDPEFEDFYVWHPGKMVNGTRQPPSNWVSVFHGSVWTWNEKRQEYFLHQFADKQPDFNFRNPKVRQYVNDVLRFWLRKGVAGFRCDAVRHIFEVPVDAYGNYPNEPLSGSTDDRYDYQYLQHIYTSDLPETMDLAYEWRKVLDDFSTEYGEDEKILMIETGSDIDFVMKYYGNETAEGAQIPFNFELLSDIKIESNAFVYAETINRWMKKMPQGRTANWVLGNHDQNRVGSRLGADRIDLLNMMVLTLPGCSVTYQGEEIGMLDVWISWEDTVDPRACNAPEAVYMEKSRDPCRSPFQWSDEMNAGFTTGNKTWLPISDQYRTVNVKKEREVSLSYLNVYKQLQALRHEQTFKLGNSQIKAANENVLAIKRSLVNNRTYIILLNINKNIEFLDLKTVFDGLPKEMVYEVVTRKSIRKAGDQAKIDQIKLQPHEAVVLKET